MGTRNKVAARRRQACTNESYETLRRLFDRGAPRRMPGALGAQALLESRVMELVASGNSWWAHPTGIAGVRITPSELLVRLDGHTVLGGGTPYPMAEYALDYLLPIAGAGVELNGVAGLRAQPLSETDLLLSLVGTCARVVLNGQEGTDWPALLAERRSRLVEDGPSRSLGLHPLWGEARLTYHERDPAYMSVRSMELDRASLGSALLRRIGWFEHYSAAYSTKCWVKGREWVLELESSYDAALPHNVLLDALADPVWGLGLTVKRQHCNCAVGRQPYPWETSCLFYLGNDEHRAPLQVRFRSAEVDGRPDYRAILTSVGAEKRWLNRVLPDQTRTKRGDRQGEVAWGNQ